MFPLSFPRLDKGDSIPPPDRRCSFPPLSPTTLNKHPAVVARSRDVTSASSSSRVVPRSSSTRGENSGSSSTGGNSYNTRGGGGQPGREIFRLVQSGVAAGRSGCGSGSVVGASVSGHRLQELFCLGDNEIVASSTANTEIAMLSSKKGGGDKSREKDVDESATRNTIAADEGGQRGSSRRGGGTATLSLPVSAVKAPSDGGSHDTTSRTPLCRNHARKKKKKTTPQPQPPPLSPGASGYCGLFEELTPFGFSASGSAVPENSKSKEGEETKYSKKKEADTDAVSGAFAVTRCSARLLAAPLPPLSLPRNGETCGGVNPPEVTKESQRRKSSIGSVKSAHGSGSGSDPPEECPEGSPKREHFRGLQAEDGSGTNNNLSEKGRREPPGGGSVGDSQAGHISCNGDDLSEDMLPENLLASENALCALSGSTTTSGKNVRHLQPPASDEKIRRNSSDKTPVSSHRRQGGLCEGGSCGGGSSGTSSCSVGETPSPQVIGRFMASLIG